MRIFAFALALVQLVACHRSGIGSATFQKTLVNNPGSSSDGGRIYIANCSSCHQLDGRGVAGIFPALGGNAAVTGDPRRAIAAVKFGLRRAPTAGGAGGVMPAWNGLLSDADIADVVTYIRFAWRNGAAPVSAAEVRAVSQTP